MLQFNRQFYHAVYFANVKRCKMVRDAQSSPPRFLQSDQLFKLSSVLKGISAAINEVKPSVSGARSRVGVRVEAKPVVTFMDSSALSKAGSNLFAWNLYFLRPDFISHYP